jgi:hypothetical protein
MPNIRNDELIALKEKKAHECIMTLNDYTAIQRKLGFIEGLILDDDSDTVANGVMDAVAVIDEILDRVMGKDGEAE